MRIKPYGDTLNDGKVELSFTLPIASGPEAEEAARMLAKKMGMADPSVVHAEAIADGFTFFVIYGAVPHAVETDEIRVRKIETPTYSKEQVEAMIEEKLGRDVVFVGASTGTDAHTVGIDAIMNMKGYAGHYGLERFKHVKAYNLGSQVPNEVFLKKAREVHADVLLVSQTVTQKEVHLKNMIELVELLEAEKMRDQVILVAGGARITHELAKELGYDAGFGPGKFAEDVASFAVLELIRRQAGK